MCVYAYARNVLIYFQREVEKRWLSIFLFHFWVCYIAMYSYHNSSNSVVPAESVNSFTSRLDKFWSIHDFV